MTQVTHLLEAAESGDPRAADELLPLVYDELRKLASQKLAQEKPGQTLQATALVHEAYLRLVPLAPGKSPRAPGENTPLVSSFANRRHFFAAAAEAMRRVLVDRARDRNRLKRGGGRVRVELLDQAESLADDPDLVLSLDELLTRLNEEDATPARIAQLHLFGGLSVEDAGKALGLSRPVAYRNWKYARAWLREALEKD
jgi:RNA polymerase sigma factor (TIGR02999 family)